MRRYYLHACAVLDAASVAACVLFVCIAKLDPRAALIVALVGILARVASAALVEAYNPLNTQKKQ